MSGQAATETRSANATINQAIHTPRAPQTFISRLISGRFLPALLARSGAFVAALRGGPFRIAGNVIVARHADVMELLSRDLDFRLPSMNPAHIDEVNGPFILGMDRSATLSYERTALYRALRATPMQPVESRIGTETKALIAAANEIDVVNGYARLIAAHTARQLFGVSSPSDDATLMDVARAIFNHTFLNIADDPIIRGRALAAAPLLKDWLLQEIESRQLEGRDLPDLMGALLREGLGADTVRRNLGGMLVGSIDTTASSVAKIIAVIGSNANLAARIAADVDNPMLLRGWCWEALRFWPHNPILLRQAAADTTLAGTSIKKSDRIVAWTQAAMQDATVFAKPSQLRPDRPASAFLHFGGGLHPCAGRSVNAIQIPFLVGALVRRGIASTGPIAWAGPFPDQLIVKFRP